MADGVKLGSIVIDLVATEDGDLQVVSNIEGTLQYVTAMGMLEMTKQNLDDHLGGDD
ncbi:hypothetical protein SEA_CHEETO1_4 [Microbacterium phage Cheeto1]|nr:hypothetical protein SEA_GAECEO_4 [Microbacterium phage GaeCeo]UVG34570.1 hypothetical protein SEA_CHEETO1_4 [Microbacterium phage Cheeto1]